MNSNLCLYIARRKTSKIIFYAKNILHYHINKRRKLLIRILTRKK